MEYVYIVQQYDDDNKIFGEPVAVFATQAAAYAEARCLNKEYAYGVSLDENNDFLGRDSYENYHYYIVTCWRVE